MTHDIVSYLEILYKRMNADQVTNMIIRMIADITAPHMNTAMTIPAKAPATTRIQRMYFMNVSMQLRHLIKSWEREVAIRQSVANFRQQN